MNRTIRILAIDVGAGTQDIVLYDSACNPENFVKLVLPAPTQVVAARIRAVTTRGTPLHLAGFLMGGGASSDAIREHLRAGLPVTAHPEAACTLHNDLERVRALGIVLTELPPLGAEVVRLGDVDVPALATALRAFEIELPPIWAIAVQDHGYDERTDAHEYRYRFLQDLLAQTNDVRALAYRTPPPYLLRMRSVQQQVPGCVLMDTGPAAVLGALCDPTVWTAAQTHGAVVVNIGNMHTFAVALRGTRIYGLFEHHTGGVTPAVLAELVHALQEGTLQHEQVIALGGHGAVFTKGYRNAAPFPFVVITGPNRSLARPLGWYEAAPFGDMMVTGSYGLIEATLRLLERESGTVQPSLLPGAPA
ncbi:DUF1786 domain-containing protein [Thermomicrobium sp. 4228-Ro]|uniref:DUF1786 domain-containing protein n=1 Tax=Thermomicrobium sp. 4228-Ro TaxID=2993937 RepID=UPI0022494AA9|nr:DUF1786 domain-containing protein [Thermomicrobium sp. 4228-Ro]MCX2727533.1 DUF1786 domain-containing protein [Thermomicrobium sp. 4228-Ro]